ncbi:MAG: FecR domain-containing protein [Cyclobacteriaceae bacterium]
MNKLPEHITEDLLAKYFAGEISAEEKEIVDQWKDHTEEAQITYYQLEALWLDLGNFGEPPKSVEVDVEKAWTELMAKRENQRPQISSPFGSWMKIAASIAVVFGLFAIIYQLNKPADLILAQTESSISKIVLADGSAATLNGYSTLEYPDTFAENTRTVTMTGEAFFDIEPNPEKPFEIKVGPALITVLGTSFNIKSNQNTDTISVYVQTGKVRFAFANQELILTAGEKGVLFSKNSFLQKQQPEPSGLDQFWRTRSLTFSGQKIPYIVQALESAYGNSIILDSDSIKACSLTAKFENEELEEILEVLSITLNLNVEKKGGSYILTGEGCISQ